MDHKVTTDYTRLLGNANVKVVDAKCAYARAFLKSVGCELT